MIRYLSKVSGALPVLVAVLLSAMVLPAIGQMLFSSGKKITYVTHILFAGQSNALGTYGTPSTSTSQPYSNKMFVTGVRAGGSGLSSLVPLIETDVDGSPSFGETPCSGMANSLKYFNATDDFLISNHAKAGESYSVIKKGSTPYSDGQAQATAGKSLVLAAGKSYRVGAVCIVHGESDSLGGNTSYDLNMVEMQSDYQSDVEAISGQSGIIPLIQAQLGNYPVSIAQQQWNACKLQPGKIFIALPRYFLPYYNDNVHQVNPGYRWMGEYFAKAYLSIMKTGSFLPVSPATISRSGATITIDFNVPVAPLVLDTTLFASQTHSGFSFDDDSHSATVSSIAITGSKQVTITLSGTPTGTNKKIQYGSSGQGGNLRDSDPTQSLYGSSLFNWCIVFNESVS